jgi:hypothetical protein
MASVASRTMVECPSEKKNSDAARRLSVLHEFAHDVVDRRDMVGIEGVPQAQGVRQQRRAEQHRIAVKCQQRPAPRADVRRNEQRLNSIQLRPDPLSAVVKWVERHAEPSLPARQDAGAASS